MSLFWDMLFGAQQPVGLLVNLVILALFTRACFDVFRGRVRLTRERALVKLASAKLRSPNREAFGSAVAGYSPESLLKFLGIPSDTLLGHRVGRAMQLRLAGLGSRDVLQQLTGEKLGSYGSLARQIGASLTLLGLLGTVFGLSLALLNIGDTSANIKGVEDLGRLSQSLGGTMGGMKTAFGCTLMGLLTALILSFLNFGLRRAQSEALGEIEEFIACDLLPSIEKIDPEADSASRAFANVLSKVSTDLVKLGSDLLDAAKEYRSSSAEVRATLDKLIGSVDQFTGTIERVGGNQDEFTKTMTATREAVDGVGASVRGSSEVLLQHLQQIRQNVDATSTVQASILSHHEEFKRLAEALRKAQADSLATALNSHEKASKELIDRVLKEHLQELKAMAERHHQSMDGVLKQSNDVMKSVADMVLDVRLNVNGRMKAASAGGGA